jgi:hypothetical protein
LKRNLPRDWLEFTTSFWPCATKGGEDSILVIDPIEITVDLGAEFSCRIWVIVVPPKSYCDALVIGLDNPSAGVGTVVMTNAMHNLHVSRCFCNRHQLIVGLLTPLLSMG